MRYGVYFRTINTKRGVLIVSTKTKFLQMYQSLFINVNMNSGRHENCECFEYDEEHCQNDHGTHAVMMMNGRGQVKIFLVIIC